MGASSIIFGMLYKKKKKLSNHAEFKGYNLNFSEEHTIQKGFTHWVSQLTMLNLVP